MRTAARVFLIIAIVVASISILVGLGMGAAVALFTPTDFDYYYEEYDDSAAYDDNDNEWTYGYDDADEFDEFSTIDGYYDYYTGDVSTGEVFAVAGVAIMVLYVALLLISGGLMLTFAIIALVQSKTRKPGVGICVCVILFCGFWGLLAGIFLLCSKPEEYGPVAPVAPAASAEPVDDAFNYTVDN